MKKLHSSGMPKDAGQDRASCIVEGRFHGRSAGALADFAFSNRVDPEGHLSTRQYARLIDEWVTAIGLQPKDYGTI